GASGRGRLRRCAGHPLRDPARALYLTERSSSRENAAVTDHTKARAPFAPWDRRELPGLFSVEESARRVGNYKWAEMRLFEALGGWVATVPELDVKMVLGRHTWFHAEHSKRWDDRLPELREMNRERLSVPPNQEFEQFIE